MQALRFFCCPGTTKLLDILNDDELPKMRVGRRGRMDAICAPAMVSRGEVCDCVTACCHSVYHGLEAQMQPRRAIRRSDKGFLGTSFCRTS